MAKGSPGLSPKCHVRLGLSKKTIWLGLEKDFCFCLNINTDIVCVKRRVKFFPTNPAHSLHWVNTQCYEYLPPNHKKLQLRWFSGKKSVVCALLIGMISFTRFAVYMIVNKWLLWY